jgi:hypothetical protein
MTRESLLGRDPSGMRSVLAWTARRAWSTWCRCLSRTVLKQSSDIVASPGTMLVPAFLDREQQQQQQHILTPESVKDAPAQRHAHCCSVCGAARHTHRRARTHTYTWTCANTQTHAFTHTHKHTHTHTCICMHTLRV